MVQSIDPMTMPLGALDPMQLLGQLGLGNFVNKSKADANHFTRAAQRAENKDIFLTGTGGKAISKSKQLEMFKDQKGKLAGQTQHVGPPSEDYSQKMQQAGNHTYQPISQAGHIHIMDEKTGKPIRGKMTSEGFNKWINKLPPEDKKGFIEGNGLIQDKSGAWMAPVKSDSAAMSAAFPGQAGKNPIAGNIFSSMSRNSWALPMIGGATGGVGGLMMGLMGAKALKSSAAGMGGMGNLGSLGALGMLGGGGSGIMGSLGGFAGFAAGGIGMGFAGLEGMAFNMKKQMRATAQSFGDQMLIGMINNPGIPIEDMIFMFMAHMGDKYEQKLRDKMEEAARAEKRSTEREREQDKARFLGGIVAAAGGGLMGLVPGVAMAAQGASMMITMQSQGKIMMKDALAGHTKSSTMLMQEVQMLTHKWKQINELMSNLLKALHDMAMTPIRNMR